MGGQWGKAWKRDVSRHSFLQVAGSKERARELAVINLPEDTRYFLIPFENGEWGWLCGSGVEICVTPVGRIRRRKIYTPAGAKAHSDRRLEKITRSCERAAEDDEST